MYNVNMTNFANGMSNVFDHDVSYRKYGAGDRAEANLPFKMSLLYKSSKESLHRFYLDYFVQLVYTFLASCLIFNVILGSTMYSGGIITEDGNTMNISYYGVLPLMAWVIIHHIQVAINIRDWNPIYIFIWIFSISMLPLNIWAANGMIRSDMYMSMYSEMLSTPLVWLQLLLLVAAVTLPFYAVRNIRAVLIEP